MAIGERIKLARKKVGLSLRALAEEVGVSAQAISKYERGLDVPSSAVLLRLAKALGVRVEYFFRQQQIALSLVGYRKCANLSSKQQQAVIAQVQDWLERYLEVESFFPVEEMPRFSLPQNFQHRVAALEDAEDAAQRLRQAWSMGSAPIESLVELLEDKGIKVGLVDGADSFDACTIRVNDAVQVIAVKRNIPGDRQRFSLAHELAHQLLEPLEEVDAEGAANRFAGAFLVPAPVARRELGEDRHNLSVWELHSLKLKYGLSMLGWAHRARELGIMSESAYARLRQRFRAKGWHLREPLQQLPPEKPERMERLVLRAMAEDLISQARATELLGKPLTEFWPEFKEESQGVESPAGVRV